MLTLNIKKSVVTPENYMTSYAIDCVVREMMQQDAFNFSISLHQIMLVNHMKVSTKKSI